MSRLCRLGGWGAVVASMFGAPVAAFALPNDLQIVQLCSNSPCSTSSSMTLAQQDPTAQERFRMLGNELGMALTGTTMEPANTVGIDGFDFAFETSFVFINGSNLGIGGQSYWPTTNEPPTALVLPAIHFRKGLPYSFEFEGRISTIGDSSMFAGTAGLKWGILEGFRYAPDISARFVMTRLFGQNDFDSTSGALDVTIGKEVGIAGLFTLSPYLGYAATGIDTSPRVIWGSQTTSQGDYQASPIAQQVLFNEATWQDNIYDRFYGGLQVTIYMVSFNVEYDYAQPSGLSSAPFTVRPGMSTIGARLALTL